LCISLFLKLFNFSCCYFYWYKQPIVSAKQPFVFLLFFCFELCSWQTEFLNLVSRKEFHSILKSLWKPPLNHSPPSSLKAIHSNRLNIWLENTLKTLKEELSNSKFDFENLEMIYQNISCKCVDLSYCESYDTVQKKVHYLLKTMDKFSQGQSNLEIVIASQNCDFGKAGLEFNQHSKNKPFSKLCRTVLRPRHWP